MVARAPRIDPQAARPKRVGFIGQRMREDEVRALQGLLPARRGAICPRSAQASRVLSVYPVGYPWRLV